MCTVVLLLSLAAAEDPVAGSRPPASSYTPLEYDPRGSRRRLPPVTSLQRDLAIVHRAFDGIILYAYDDDLTPKIAEVAARQRFKGLVLGIWDPRSNDEIAGVALIKKYRGRFSLACIVGNEGITFGRYQNEDLVSAAAKLRESLGTAYSVPLATSEPLGAFADRSLMRLAGYDFIALNCHPVFDQSDLGPAAAAAWVRGRATVLAEVSGLPVLVKETGFPNGGKEPYSPQAQAAFWKSYLAHGTLVPVDERGEVFASYAAAFEYANLDWKAEETRMSIENHWGLVDQERDPYPAFQVWLNRQKGKKR